MDTVSAGESGTEVPSGVPEGTLDTPPMGIHVEPLAELAALDPRVRTLWWVISACVAAPVMLTALIIDLALAPRGLRGFLTGLVVLVAGGLAAGIPVVRYRRWRYALRPRDLWIRRGIIWVTLSVIPYQRLQFVDTRQGPLDRLFGLGRYVTSSATSRCQGCLRVGCIPRRSCWLRSNRCGG
jgi:membrane protein YdbS with pleckstrin-like domain